ncbi:MAG: GtrA family protein [Oscillospiraceae bacterium]|nr:GtrA family protein [Oscillospiraceae bacterium]
MADETRARLTRRQSVLMAVKFVLFSASAGIVQLGSFTLLHEFTALDKLTGLDELFGNDYGLTYFIALVLSVLWNFTFNRKFTFKSAANLRSAMLRVFAFYLVFTPLSIWWGVALTKLGWNDYLVLGLTMLVNLSTEYIYDRYVVYRKTLYTSEAGRRELDRSAGDGES